MSVNVLSGNIMSGVVKSSVVDPELGNSKLVKSVTNLLLPLPF